MNNTATRMIRSEEITIDMRICTILAGGKKPGEVYFAAIAPDMELTVITLDEAPDILPCFDESDASIHLPDTSLLLCYNPAQVLKMAGKRYLTGPVILVRTNIYILCNWGQKKIPLGTKGRTSILSYREYVRPAELHSRSAEKNCLTENVSSLRSVKGATLPCDACASIPCGLAVRKQHEMLFAASKFGKINTENQTVDWSQCAKS